MTADTAEGHAAWRRKAAKKQRDWRLRVRRQLPALASRVFSLRGKSCPGHIKQETIERQLAAVILIASDLRFKPTGDAVVDEVVVEALFETLALAERGDRNV